MTRLDCSRIECLAGAIALDEASEREREAYRRHLSVCSRCVEAFGGEREIARVMATVAQARDEESWEPDLRAALRDRTRMRRSAWRLGLGVGATAIAISLGLHFALAGALQPVALIPAQTVAAVGSTFHVQLEQRPKAFKAVPERPAPAAVAANPKPLTVAHNVVALQAAPVETKTASEKPAPQLAAADPAIAQAQAPSENERNALKSMQTQSAAPAYESRAESLAIVPVRQMIVREPSLLGGHFPALNPPAIASREMVNEGLDEATAVFNVSIDDRGVATSCSIEKSSGIPAIDESVCRAAMRAHYNPKTVNGKATAGSYRDAIVFLNNQDNE